MSILEITSIIDSLLSIGVNLTDIQKDLLNWRLSPEAKKYYSEKENTFFYESLLKGDISIVDAIRKEKQEKIDQMKRELGFVLILIFSMFVTTSCFTRHPSTSIPIPHESTIANIIPNISEVPKDVPQEHVIDPNSLKTTEKTFPIKDQEIRVSGDIFKTKFPGNWFMVHEDLIKNYNENQDTLIEVLKQNSELKIEKINIITENQKSKNIIIGVGCSIILFLLCLGAVILRRK